MYQNIYFDRRTQTAHIWDDVGGYQTTKFQNYAFRKRPGGRYKSIYGDDLERVTYFNPKDPSLFGSDIPIETKILIDLYESSDEVSTGHRIGCIDIETDSEGGFPSVELGDKEITAIALYDYVQNKYIAFLLDKENTVKSSSIDGTEIIVSNNEYNLLSKFLDKWEELSFSIVTGWNCIPLTQSIWLSNKIIKMKDLNQNDMLCDSNLIKKYPISNKGLWEITLENGTKIQSSGDHKFPVKLVNKNEYVTFNRTIKSNYIDVDLTTRQIQSFSENNDVYCELKLRNNTNEINKNYTNEQLYLAGLIYTDGSLKDKNNPKYGYTIYQSDKDLLEKIQKNQNIESKISGPNKNCYSMYINPSNLGYAHELIYENSSKKLNLELLSTLSYKQFMSFLSGMLDGDGCKGNGNGYKLCNYNNNDLDTIHELCNWNGIFCTQTKNMICFIEINEKDLSLFKSKRWATQTNFQLKRNSKQKSSKIRFKKINGVYFVKVKDVKNIGKSVRMMDIETDTHYFVTRGVKTHNCDGFDMPYLYNRITNVMGGNDAKRISPIRICYLNDWSKKLVIAGISCLDYMQLFTKYMDKKEPSYALDAIAKKHIGIGKIEFEGSLNHLYKTDIQKYIEYNIHDVKLVVELDKKYKYIELARKICHTGHVPYESFAWSSRYIEGAILTYLRRNGGLIAPNKPIEGREEYELQLESNQEGFDGAYVKEPVLGKHKYVYDLDLTSMYPKIIISLNISPETKSGKIDNWDSEKYVTGELQKIFIAGNEYSREEFEKLLREQNLSVSSNGVLYSLNKKGIIPSILSSWFKDRVEMRKLEKKYGQENNTEMYQFYNQRQLVQKIMLNSVYGVLGLPLFRFYDKDNAEAVTTSGVTIIQTAGKAINMYYNNILNDEKDYVIYTDTDSCFSSALPIISKLKPDIDIKNEQEMIKETLDLCSKVQKYVNDMFNIMAKKLFNLNYHEFEAKQEVIARSSFWLAKKKYTQSIINKNGIECDEIEIKGIDVVRTNFPIGFKKFMNEFLRDLLKDTAKEDIDKKIYDFEKSLCDIPVIELAKNTSIKFISLDKKKNYDPVDRVPFNYILGTPAQVKAGLAYNDLLLFWNLHKKYPKLMNGQKIKWVYLMENDYGIDALAMKADGTDPKEILDFIEKYIDRNQLYNQELKSKLSLFYDVQNWVYPTEASMNTSVIFTDF